MGDSCRDIKFHCWTVQMDPLLTIVYNIMELATPLNIVHNYKLLATLQTI